VVTAQETFKTMLRDQVAPQLRSLGFKGSGQNFALPSETHWALLGFQKSAWSDTNKVSFYINLTVVGREDWEKGREAWPNVPERPGANWDLSPLMESAFVGYWHTRLGFLMPGGRGRIWTVSADDDPRDVAEAVVAEIVEFAIPAMRERIGQTHFANPS
jgi:hypothetical protein